MSRGVASSVRMGKGPTISIRLHDDAERDVIRKAARKAGMLPTQWMRQVLLEAAGAHYRVATLGRPPSPDPRRQPMATKEITRKEFDRYGIARSEHAKLMFEERRWFANEDGTAIGFVALDKHDKDWQWMVLKKSDGLYRADDFAVSLATEQEAVDALLAALA